MPLAARPGPLWTADAKEPHPNTIYVSTRALTIDGADLAVRGGGVFSNTDCRLTLTAPEASTRSHWKLPGWFLPAGGRPLLSYHGDEERWRRDGLWVHVQTVGRGQEFVCDVDGIPEAAAWLRGLFA